MGNYLATPNCRKLSQSGASTRLAYAASSMQGWRVAMEDSHLIYHSFRPLTEKQWPRNDTSEQPDDVSSEEKRKAHFFGIYDGHGGSEIANFAANTIVSELEKTPQFGEGNFEIAFKVAYCNLDRILRSRNWTGSEAELQKNEALLQPLMNDSGRCKGCMCVVPHGEVQLADAPPSLEEASTLVSRIPLKSSSWMVQSWGRAVIHQVANLASRIGSVILPSTVNANASTQLEELVGRQSAQNRAMFSGCTAVSLLLIENSLYVANAGDSRAVLCRAGKAIPLSRDHKPTLPEERKRIYAAGGFIEFGRVNGNLNLSRAIGDLIYKQDLSQPPEKQIVSGFPEVKRFDLLPEDEFIIMGCDGIWEFFSSQDVVDFIRTRFRGREEMSGAFDYEPSPTRDCASETPTASPQAAGRDMTKIIEELFEALVSPNPALFEYGCDNMTAILIDLRPGLSCECACHEVQRKVQQQLHPEAASELQPNAEAFDDHISEDAARHILTDKGLPQGRQLDKGEVTQENNLSSDKLSSG